MVKGSRSLRNRLTLPLTLSASWHGLTKYAASQTPGKLNVIQKVLPEADRLPLSKAVLLMEFAY